MSALVKLDRSRPESIAEVHGHGVKAVFGQDGFYFDNAGNLIEDDEWLMDAGAKARLEDLRTKAEAEAAAKEAYARVMRDKGKILSEAGVQMAGADDEDEQEDDGKVNIVAWAKGELKVSQRELFAAAREQYAVNVSNTSDLIAFMIEQGKIAGADVKVRVRG